MLYSNVLICTAVLWHLVTACSLQSVQPHVKAVSVISIDSGRFKTQVSKQPCRDTIPNPLQNERVSEDMSFVEYEQQPTFPGDVKALHSFIKANLKMPKKAKEAGVSGRVFVSFTIEDTGEIKDVYVVKGLGFGCDQEAIRLVRCMPNWKPGTWSGKPVKVKFYLPISFKDNRVPN